jgi:hypothetical protein
MTYRGKVQNGVVVIEGPIKPRDGADVRVEEIAKSAPAARDGSIWADLQALAGTAEGLPGDLAENHDHYIHGTAKRRS